MLQLMSKETKHKENLERAYIKGETRVGMAVMWRDPLSLKMISSQHWCKLPSNDHSAGLTQRRPFMCTHKQKDGET